MRKKEYLFFIVRFSLPFFFDVGKTAFGLVVKIRDQYEDEPQHDERKDPVGGADVPDIKEKNLECGEEKQAQRYFSHAVAVPPETENHQDDGEDCPNDRERGKARLREDFIEESRGFERKHEKKESFRTVPGRRAATVQWMEK